MCLRQTDLLARPDSEYIPSPQEYLASLSCVSVLTPKEFDEVNSFFYHRDEISSVNQNHHCAVAGMLLDRRRLKPLYSYEQSERILDLGANFRREGVERSAVDRSFFPLGLQEKVHIAQDEGAIDLFACDPECCARIEIEELEELAKEQFECRSATLRVIHGV